MQGLPDTPIDGPIRVVLFCGPALERETIRFAMLLESHSEVEFLGGYVRPKDSTSVGTRRPRAVQPRPWLPTLIIHSGHDRPTPLVEAS